MSRLWVPTETPIYYSITTIKARPGFTGWLARRLKLSYGWIVKYKSGENHYVAVETGESAEKYYIVVERGEKLMRDVVETVKAR